MLFRHEAVATQALAKRMPELVPEVIAVDGARGWMLMRDLGAAELGDQDESLWHEGVMAHARIQQSWLGRADELVALGLPVRSLTDLAAQVEAMTEDTVLLGRMSPDVRERWLATAPALVASCRRLDEIGPGPTLVHGDFHPWNVAFGPANTRVFDWTDAAVSHPFVDLATYVFRTEDVAVRRRLVDAYVGGVVEGGVRGVASGGGSPRSGCRGAVPGADLPCPPADADGKRCRRRTGGWRPGLDQAQPDVPRARPRQPGLTSQWPVEERRRGFRARTCLGVAVSPLAGPRWGRRRREDRDRWLDRGRSWRARQPTRPGSSGGRRQ